MRLDASERARRSGASRTWSRRWKDLLTAIEKRGLLAHAAREGFFRDAELAALRDLTQRIDPMIGELDPGARASAAALDRPS